MRHTGTIAVLAKVAAVSGMGLLLLLPGAAGAQEVVGGITPSMRPETAPKLSQVSHDQGWYRRALTGVSKPYPQSLLWLDHQGDWYTPFTRRGAPGPYDIRRTHAPAR